MYHSLFDPFTYEKHLCRFHLLVILNEAALTICTEFLCGHCFTASYSFYSKEKPQA